MLEKVPDQQMAGRISSAECWLCSRYLVVSGKSSCGFRVCLKAPDGSFLVIEAIDRAIRPGSAGDKSGGNAEELLPMRVDECGGSLCTPKWVC